MKLLQNLGSPTDLCLIMETCGSDKGGTTNPWHNYTKYYSKLFNERKDTIQNVFELGLGTTNPAFPANMGPYGKPGASLRGWKTYFKNANIYGADIDRQVLFTEERIQTFFCDQTNPIIIKQMWNSVPESLLFDVIVDDGYHEFNANVCFFENSIYKLNNEGVYIIEDILKKYIPLFEQKIKEWTAKYPNLSFEIFELDSERNKADNVILVCKKSN